MFETEVKTHNGKDQKSKM